jgi:tetratricopeptide (TPR) repeat protein
MVLAGILATVPFFVTDRYRVQLVPALAVLAAVWLRGAAVAIRLRDGHRIGVAIGAGLLGVAVTFIPLHAVDKDYEDWLSRADLGVRWLEVGNTPAALESFRSAVGMEAGLTADSTVASLTRADRAELHFNYGVALRRAGHMEDALLELETAARIDPTNAHYVRTLGDAALVAGRTREADSLLARVPRLVGGEAESALSEGYRAARSGHLAAAERSLRAAALADARLFGAWGALITVQVLRNENDEAERTLRRAADAGMPNVSLAIYDGLVGAARGDTLRAARSLTGGGSEQLDPNLARALALTRAIVRGEVRRPVPEP